MKKRSDFSTALAYWMYRNDLNGEQVAEMTGLDRAVISRAKNGKRVGAESESKLKKLMQSKGRAPK